MFCARKNPDNIESMASLLILGGVLPLAFVMVAQYGFHLRPCHFCLLQRWPYLPVILLGVLSLLVKRGGIYWRACVALGIYGLLTTATLGLIHTAIEHKWLDYKGGCVAQRVADGSLEALRASIANAPLVACNEVAASFAGLSMASWNCLWALTVILLIALQYRFDRTRHAR